MVDYLEEFVKHEFLDIINFAICQAVHEHTNGKANECALENTTQTKEQVSVKSSFIYVGFAS